MEIIKPGNFGSSCSTDALRLAFDIRNEQLIYNNAEIDYLFIGDSITQYWELDAYFKTDKILINRGIGGDRSEFLLRRFDADCVQLKPKNVIVLIGTNDIFSCEDDLWWRTKGADMETVLERYKSNIKGIIEKCDKNNINLYLCSIIPSTIAPPFDREKRWALTDKMNEFLKSTGKPYINYFDALTEDGKNIIYDCSPDGIHANAKGYEIMAKVLKETINL